jgi:hypothetical protein
LLNTSGTGDKVIYPGSFDHSAILKRMTSTNTDRMPPLGTSIVDAEAVKLISDWVTQELPSAEAYDAWANRLFGGTVPPGDQDADGDGRSNYTEYLLGTNPLQPDAPQSVIAAADRARATITITQPANRAIVVESTDGFPAANWSVLNDPINDQKFPASALTRTFTDPIGNGTKYYRLRVIEP